MAEGTLNSPTLMLKKSDSPTNEAFDVNGVTGQIHQAAMNASVTGNGSTQSYSTSGFVPSTAQKVWVESGFLDIGSNSYLPVNFDNGSNRNWCWWENGYLKIASNTWSGTAYIILKFIV